MANRQYDIWLFDKESGITLKPSSGGRVCTGLVKLAQRFITCFISPLGGDPFDAIKGTRVPTLKISSVVAGTFIDSEISRCVGYVQQHTPDTAPNDEVLVDAKRKNLTVNEDKVYVSIQITSAAGDFASLEVPTGLAII